MKRGRGAGARHTDLATTRKACEKFRRIPTSVINFVKGTRFTTAKHAHQQSPYEHLLTPKMGGLGIALATMGEMFTAMVDVTIAYPDSTPTFSRLLRGEIGRVAHPAGPAVRRSASRHRPPPTASGWRLAAWIDAQWREKDAVIKRVAQTEQIEHRPG